MGTSCSKIKVAHSPATLDYGSVTPQGIYTTNTDYDMTIVRTLIRKGRLAPFYQGSTEPTISNKIAYETECPICFLFYPSKMNRTRCCDKSICTECFLQLRRSVSSPLTPVVCPFCVQSNLGVLYIPPLWSKHYYKFSKRRSDLFTTSKQAKEDDIHHRRQWKLEADDPDVVLVDKVRPNWQDMLQERRSSAVGTTRRRRVQLNNNRVRHSMDMYDDQSSNYTIYDDFADIDLEDIFVMEAIRLSLMPDNNNA